jgi:ppGpp synthetase/RelA/SpoT-type nucleotidyltranferase
MDLKNLHREFLNEYPLLERYQKALRDQVLELLQATDVALGVPLEARIKSWDSIVDKAERHLVEPKSIHDFTDLVGLRAIFLFRRDLEKAVNAVATTFVVVSREDAADRLGETGFGYQSIHLIVKIPLAWASLPALRGCGELVAELQLRTLAQHIWAVASHKLQYKKESSVPGPIRRAIHRASALLETVDLEFERVLTEREAYVASDAVSQRDEPLNVDSLERMLTDRLPPDNLKPPEPYSQLLGELLKVGVDTVAKLNTVIDKHLTATMKEDRGYVAKRKRENSTLGTTFERTKRGVYFSHVGLVRVMAEREFGAKWK